MIRTLTLVACVTLLGTPAAAAEVAFDEHEVVLGPAERLTVLTGFLLDGPVAELAAVHIDDNGDRRLRIYAFDERSWTQVIDARLRPGVSFVDVAGIGGRDRLITYEAGRLSWFDPDSPGT